MKSIDKVFLPLSSDNEEIETISRIKFIQLFDPSRFILKDEVIDNGIDFRNEIIINSGKTGFGFNFQLKSRINAIKNVDGSYSKTIETSNIEYLINNGQPAFYGFYIKNEDKIYYEDLNDFINSLHKKKIDWEEQPSHTLRFYKILDLKAVDEIYNITIKKGKLIRELTYKTAIASSEATEENNIIIDFNQNITDDSEIREMIEGLGLELINEGRWSEILYVHKNASGKVATTALYNLILGIANYYSGNIVNAISFFKLGNKLNQQLSSQLNTLLQFFDSSSRYAIGMISKDEYDANMIKLQDSENIGLYIKLDQAKQKYIDSILTVTGSGGDYETLLNDIQEIINHTEANSNIALLAKCELVFFEGHNVNIYFIQEASNINVLEEIVGPNVQMRIEAAKRLIEKRNNWLKNSHNLKKVAYECRNYFAYFNAILLEIKNNYEFDAFSSIVYVEKEIPNQPPLKKPDKSPMFTRMLTDLKQVSDFYTRVGYVENIIAALSLTYEVQHYLEDYDAANVTMEALETLVNTTDSKEYSKKLLFLKREGTRHESFKIFTENILNKAKDNKKEIDELIELMDKMDKEERFIIDKNIEKYTIDLLPISYFQFPKQSLKEVFKILNITEVAQVYFEYIFSLGIIPIANIYYQNIVSEGALQGHMANTGVESWRNI